MRRDHKIVLKLSLVSVVDHVDAGIDFRVMNPAVRRDICMPFLWVIADQVVDFSRQFVLTLNARSRIRANHLQTQDGSFAQ